MEYKKHKYNIYPEMQPEEFNRLREDIFVNGYDSKKPIWIYDNEIIDGWNRYRACLALNVTPPFKKFEGSDLDAIQFIVRSNNRRDLNSSQRAAIAVDADDLITALRAEAKQRSLANLSKRWDEQQLEGELIPPPTNNEATKVRTQLAKAFQTNPRYVTDAARIKKQNPKAFEQIKKGTKVITQVKKEEKKERHKAKLDRQVTIANELKIESKNNKNPIDIERGEWYKIGRHYLYCGDNTDKNFIDNLPQVAFAFADPPYNAGVAHWDNDFLWQQDYLQGVADIVAVTPGISSIRAFLCATDMNYKWSHSTHITNGMTRGALGFGNFILTLLFSNHKSIHRNSQDIFNISISNADAEQHYHKGKKPDHYMINMIELFTKENELTIDPFLGSGTTLFVCELLNRGCIGAEKDIEYFKLIVSKFMNKWPQQNIQKQMPTLATSHI
jgi:hypothetical protein